MILKSGFIKEIELQEVENLEESVYFPSNMQIYNVKRVLYFPGNIITNSDLIRGRRLDNSLIESTLDLIGMAGLGKVSKTPSTSNRNRGVFYIKIILKGNVIKLVKLNSSLINSTPTGRARFKLFRLDKDQLDESITVIDETM